VNNVVFSGIQALLLEKEAYPALDELTSKISTLNLERVRQIKSRLVAISGRVQKVASIPQIWVQVYISFRFICNFYSGLSYDAEAEA
jgi:hypothetical protein